MSYQYIEFPLKLYGRAQKCPGDLRAKLSTKKSGAPVKSDNFHLNPLPLKRAALPNLQFTVDNAPKVKKIVSAASYSPLVITRTVKNESVRNPNAIIIDTRDSSDEEDEAEVEKKVNAIHHKHTRKRRRSRSVN